MIQDWQSILIVVGLIQGCLVSVLLFHKSGGRHHIQVLSIYVMIFTLGLLEPILENYRSTPFLAFVGDLLGGSSYLYGPLLYLYAHTSTGGKLSSTLIRKHLSLYILYLVGCTFLFLVSGGKIIDDGLLEIILLIILVSQLIYYSIISIHKVSQSKIELKVVVYAFATFYLLGVLAIILALFGLGISEKLFIVVQCCAIILIYLVSYVVLLTLNPIANKPDSNPYESSALSESLQREYMSKIKNIFEVEEAYLNPELNIALLADRLEVNRSYISQTINAETGKGFSEYLNSFRIERVKELLHDPEKDRLTLWAIALEAGFNSKTTFNTSFKRSTGMTPSAYKKNCLSRNQN